MNPTLTDTFRRLLAAHEARGEHVDPVVIALPPDLDPADRDALIDVARGSPSVIVVDHQDLAPLVDHGAYIAHGSPLHDALARLNTTLDHLPPKDPHMLAALPLILAAASGGYPRMPGERDLFRVPTKAPKPPPEVQDAIMAAAEDRRERKRIRNLVSVGHTYGCANVIVLCGSACTCGAKKGASNV